MLQKLMDIGKKVYAFEELQLKNLEKSCCSSEECRVVDFDKAKESCIKIHSLNSTASCDGLKICTQQNQIDFIEMKGFEEYKKYNRNIDKKSIEAQVAKFDFNKKIEESLYILQTIINSTTFNASKDEKNKFKESTKRYFIVTDIDVKKDALATFEFTMNYLASSSNMDKIIVMCLEDKVKSINKTCYSIQKPKLISCKDICKIVCGEKIKH